MVNHKKMLFWLLCSFLFLIPANTFASGVNVELRRRSSEKDGMFGDLQMGGSLQHGNTNIITINASGLLGFRKRRHTVFAFGSYSYTSEALFSKENIESGAMAHVRYNFEIKKWIYWEVFGQVETDQNLFIDMRNLVGTGPRFVLFEDFEQKVILGSSYMPVYEILSKDVVNPYPSGFSDRKTWSHRWNNYFGYNVNITNQFSFQTTVYAQPRFDRFLDLKLFNENILTMEVNELLDLNLALAIVHDRETPSVCQSDICRRLKNNDISTQAGLRIKF